MMNNQEIPSEEVPQVQDISDNGPDRLIPAESLRAWTRDGAVKIRSDSDNPKCVSVPTTLIQTTEKYPDRLAMAVQRDGDWVKWNYTQYLKDVRTCAKAFVHLGLERLDAVAILGANSPEWFIADMGAIFAGGIAYGIYPTNTSDACLHCLDNSDTKIILVEDQKQLDKIIPLKSKLPNLKAIIQYAGEPTVEGVYSWSQLMEIGLQQPDSLVDSRLKQIAVNQCCVLVYTSGTTGLPKAVMLSHDNLTAVSESFSHHHGITSDQEQVIISYLPLSHIAAQFADIYLPIYNGAAVYFAAKDALKGSLLTTLREVRPTFFLGVPRIWEKIYEKMTEREQSASTIQRILLNWAKGLGWENTQRKMSGNETTPFGYGLASWLILQKIKQEIGLDRALLATGAAPLSKEVMQHFASLDMPLMETFGMSESSGPCICANKELFRMGSVGKPILGVKVKIDQPDSDGNGEMCVWGRNVFMGYLNNEEATKDTLDDDGYLHSGDVAKLDDFGYLTITGRIKEILITAGGENIPAPLIELSIKKELPCLSQVVLIGDKKKFLSVLLALNTKINPGPDETKDTLSDGVQAWMQSIGASAKTITELLQNQDPKVTAAIQEGINKVNKNAISSAQKVQKWAILPKDLSMADGELSPTFKLRRHIVEKKFADIIDSIYAV